MLLTKQYFYVLTLFWYKYFNLLGISMAEFYIWRYI